MWELPRYHAQAYAATNGEAMKQNRLLARLGPKRPYSNPCTIVIASAAKQSHQNEPLAFSTGAIASLRSQ
jgi:hypothetical protein